MKLKVLSQTMAICRLDVSDEVPEWALLGALVSVTRTSEELSVVCEERNVPLETRAEKGWSAFKVEGPLDFGMTGVLSSLAAPLAAQQISIFVISTFDTDYLLVKEESLARAVEVLRQAGHAVLRI